MKPKLKAPGTQRLKLKYDEPVSNFGFKFKLRRYSLGASVPGGLWHRAGEHANSARGRTDHRRSRSRRSRVGILSDGFVAAPDPMVWRCNLTLSSNPS
jgi:hypothetical protein